MTEQRMHGPVTDERIEYTLRKLRIRSTGYTREATLLIEAMQYERQILTADLEAARSEVAAYREALKQIQQEVGTSTLASLIARQALAAHAPDASPEEAAP